MRLTRINAVRCTIGEAPVWDEREQALYFLDIPCKQVLRLDPETGALQAWESPSPPTALALGGPGEVLLASGDAILRLDLASGESDVLARVYGQPANATLNDGRVDRQGRFVIGSCCTDFAAPTPVGGIYSLAQGQCVRVANDIMFSNGTCFSPDGGTLYFADGARHAIYAFDYDTTTGQPDARNQLADTSALGGMPDGATVSADGRLWVAINPGGKVAAYRPDGTLDQVIDLPVGRPGSVTFGGPNLDRLFVTTLDPTCFGEAPDDMAGYLYVIDGLNTRGLPEPRYHY